jgi:hypothetical protein
MDMGTAVTGLNGFGTFCPTKRPGEGVDVTAVLHAVL